MGLGALAAKLGQQALKLAAKLTARNALALARRMVRKIVERMTRPAALAKQGLKQATNAVSYQPRTGLEGASQTKIGDKTLGELARERAGGGG